MGKIVEIGSGGRGITVCPEERRATAGATNSDQLNQSLDELLREHCANCGDVGKCEIPKQL